MRRNLSLIVRVGCGIAGVLLVVFWIVASQDTAVTDAVSRVPQEQTEAEKESARIRRLVGPEEPNGIVREFDGCIWEVEPPVRGNRFDSGDFRLVSGAARMEFISGTVLTLKGPSSINLRAGTTPIWRGGDLIGYYAYEAAELVEGTFVVKTNDKSKADATSEVDQPDSGAKTGREPRTPYEIAVDRGRVNFRVHIPCRASLSVVAGAHFSLVIDDGAVIVQMLNGTVYFRPEPTGADGDSNELDYGFRIDTGQAMSFRQLDHIIHPSFGQDRFAARNIPFDAALFESFEN